MAGMKLPQFLRRYDLTLLAVATDDQWRAFVKLLGAPAWAQAHELSTAAGRRTRHEEIDRHVERWLAHQQVDGAVTRMLRAGVPAAVMSVRYCGFCIGSSP